MLSHDMIFNLGSVKVGSAPETCFSCDKDILIAVSDYHMYFYLIVLFLLVAKLHFIKLTAS